MELKETTTHNAHAYDIVLGGCRVVGVISAITPSQLMLLFDLALFYEAHCPPLFPNQGLWGLSRELWPTLHIQQGEGQE